MSSSNDKSAEALADLLDAVPAPGIGTVDQEAAVSPHIASNSSTPFESPALSYTDEGRENESDNTHVSASTLIAQRAASPANNPRLSPHQAHLSLTVDGNHGGVEKDDPYASLISTLRRQNADLHSQVTELNTKLGYQDNPGRYGDLEEALDRAHLESDGLRKRCEALMQERQQWESRVEGGLLVEKAHVQTELTRMMDRVIEETAQRGKAEADKETIEKELDELSASLFNEANRMVAHERQLAAQERQFRSVAEVKTRSIEDRLRDTEGLISHQAEQMRHLGSVIEDLERQRDESKAKLTSMEQDPAVLHLCETGSSQNMGLASTSSVPVSPRSGTLLNAAAPAVQDLLYDILPHHEFHIFIRHLHRLRINILSRAPSETSSGHTILPTSGGSAPSSPDPQTQLNAVLPLSQHMSQPFIKRCLEEDSDPALRLDLAPGLNWLNRRQVAQSIVDGQLVIEPAYMTFAPTEKCALCGTALDKWLLDSHADQVQVGAGANSQTTGGQAAVRKLMGTQSWASQGWAKWGPKSLSSVTNAAPLQSSTSSSLPLSDQIPFLHVFRASEITASGTRYPLCPTYCLPRLRAVCEFWTAIRNIERALLLGARAPTQALVGSRTFDQGHRKTRGIASVSSLLRRTTSGESRFPATRSPMYGSRSPATANDGTEIIAIAIPNTSQAIQGESKRLTCSPEPNMIDVQANVVPWHTDLSSRTDEPEKLSPPPASTTVSTDALVDPIDETIANAASGSHPDANAEIVSRVTPPPLPTRSETWTPNTQPPVSVTTLGPPLPVRPAALRRTTPIAPTPIFERQTGVETLAEPASWEDKSWRDLVKLKEALFWARMGASGPR